MLLAILSTILVTVFFTVVFLNLRAGEKQIRHKLAHEFSVEHPQFLRSMGNLLGAGLLPGNRVQAFHNGVQIFPAMLEAIRGACHTITFETYIYWSGEIGREFSDALCERARAGVKVHVMLDWAGSVKMEVRYLEALEAAGVEVEKFHPLRWYTLTRLNNRTHRKLLVVDGRFGFTGGVGIADLWQGDADSKVHWRDSHFRLNDETNLNIYDAAFAREQVQVFEDDKRHSRLMTRAELQKRSAVGKALDALACTIRRQL